VVSAGLAVGVFCGLLFGLGTGTTEAAPEPAKGNNVKSGGTAEAAPTPTTPTTPTTAGTTPPSTGSAIAGNGSTKNPAAIAAGTGSPTVAAGTGSAATTPAAATIKLTVEITPEAAASVAKITIDGKEITGKTIDLPIDKKSVKVSITAAGFHSIDKKIDLAGPGDTTIKQEMAKRGTGTASPGFGGASTGGNHVPTSAPKPPKKPPNSGIIDI
jgi:hypothetical protein